jgi:hypothetical protein
MIAAWARVVLASIAFMQGNSSVSLEPELPFHLYPKRAGALVDRAETSPWVRRGCACDSAAVEGRRQLA